MRNVYLVIVTLGGNPPRGRIKAVAASLQKQLLTLDESPQIAFTSSDGSTLAVLVQSELKAWQVAQRVFPEKGVSHLENTDNLMVYEVGLDTSGIGNLKVQSWIDARFQQKTKGASNASARGESTSRSQLASQLAEIKDKLGKRGQE